MHTVATFGTAQDVVNVQQGESWSVEGPFQKIGIKSRIWDSHHIVQGLRVTLMDGTTKSFGIENDDTIVVELEIPKGQHIKDVMVRSGWYIDQIGFRTNENIQLGPVGGDGGSYQKLAPNGKHSIKQTYLHSIKGKTFEAQNAPCIAAMNFVFAEVPNVHWKDEAQYPIYSIPDFLLPVPPLM